MSELKKKIIAAILLASISIVILAGVSMALFPSQSLLPVILNPQSSPQPTSASPASPSAPISSQTPAASQNLQTPQPTSAPTLRPPGPINTSQGTWVWPLYYNVELNASQGFAPSTLAYESENWTLLVLQPNESGSVPFQVYSNSTNETISVSLSIELASPSLAYYGVRFNVSPSSIVIKPGEKGTAALNVIADQDAPTALYRPIVYLDTNASDIHETQIPMPDILVSTNAPLCLALVNDQGYLPPTSLASPPSPPVSANASAGLPNPIPSLPPMSSSTPRPNLSATPTINIAPGAKGTFMFSCLTQANLTLDVTAQTGFSYEFSPNSTDIILGSTTAKMYALTVTAASNISLGTYEVNYNGSVDTYQFSGSFYVTVT